MSEVSEENAKNLLAASKHLAETDPQSDAVSNAVRGLQNQITIIKDQMSSAKKDTFGHNSMQQDVDHLQNEISRMKSAAEIPAHNWKRIYSIIEGLHRVAILAARPQNIKLIPDLQRLTAKVAGIFQEVDTTDDLDKPLDAIEKAVHALYGDQSQNSTYYFDRRGKGHHEKSDLSEE